MPDHDLWTRLNFYGPIGFVTKCDVMSLKSKGENNTVPLVKNCLYFYII